MQLLQANAFPIDLAIVGGYAIGIEIEETGQQINPKVIRFDVRKVMHEGGVAAHYSRSFRSA